MVPCANPRIHVRKSAALGLGQPVKRHRPDEPKLPRRFPLTVAWPASAPQTESWERKKHGEKMGKRHVFFLFLVPDPAVGKKKEQSDNAALSQVCPLRIYGAMYAFFWGRGGIRITTRIRSSTTRGADFSAPRISQQSVINFSTGGDWVTGERDGALSSLASKAWFSPSGRAGGRAWSSGETKVKSGCGCGFAGFLSRGRCEASGPMGGSRPLIEEGRPMWCEGNCDVV